MPDASSHRDLQSPHHPGPQSSRDLSQYTSAELDQLRKSNANIKLTKWEATKLFFWNSTERTVCYRTGTSWLFIVVFYSVFAGVIVALFYGMMLIMIFCIKTYALTPVINKDSLTKEPEYI